MAYLYCDYLLTICRCIGFGYNLQILARVTHRLRLWCKLRQNSLVEKDVYRIWNPPTATWLNHERAHTLSDHSV
jgi:hypothetical protein